jgi:excisionase family DNA binding protein
MTHRTPAPRKPKKRRAPKPPTKHALAHRIDEFVERARTSRPTVYRLMNEGKLRYIIVRNHRLIPVSEYARLGYVEVE